MVGLYDVYTNISELVREPLGSRPSYQVTDVVSKLLLWNHGVRAIRLENRTTV